MTSIGVAIKSRKRPEKLKALVGDLRAMASGRVDVKMAVGIDSDDLESQALQLPKSVDVCITDPAEPVFKRYNDLVESLETDIVCILPDDVRIQSRSWDLAASLLQDELCSWAFNGGNCWWYPIIKRGLLDAMNSRPLPECFPFWFADRWLIEVYMMAVGRTPYWTPALSLTGQDSKTIDMRDMKFWRAYYDALKPRRIAEAVLVAKTLRLPTHGIEDRAKEVDRIFSGAGRDDDKWEAERASDDVSPAYMALRHKAELHMMDYFI